MLAQLEAAACSSRGKSRERKPAQRNAPSRSSGSSVEGALETLTGGLTAKSAQSRLESMGFRGFVLDRFPDVQAELPVPERAWTRFDVAEPWRTLLKKGTINVLVTRASWTDKKQKGTEGHSSTLEKETGRKILAQRVASLGSLVEVDGVFFRVIGHFDGGLKNGGSNLFPHVSSLYAAADGRGLAHVQVDGYNIDFAETGSRPETQLPFRHVPNVVINLAHADPNAHRRPKIEKGQTHYGRCRCWFTQPMEGLVLERIRGAA
jgi:hypothetical protein